jgi:hypothetical protein
MGRKAKYKDKTICIKCNASLPQSLIDIYEHVCNRCRYAALPEPIKAKKRAQAKEWRAQNLERAKEAVSRWGKNNPDKVREYSRRKKRKRSRKINNTPEQWKKVLCRARTKYAVKSGKLKKSLCEGCGSRKVEAHHEDYDRPYMIRWLCPSCHKDVHKYVVLPPKTYTPKELMVADYGAGY